MENNQLPQYFPPEVVLDHELDALQPVEIDIVGVLRR